MNKTATNYHHQQVIFVSAGFTETNPLPAELNSLFTQGNLNEENVYYVGDFTKAVSKEMIQQALT